MRKIDEAFSDSLKAPGDVIPIQDVLLVRIEPLARYRPHAILAIRDNAYLSFRASPPLSCYRLNVLFGTAILVPDDREHFAMLSVRLDPPRDDLQTGSVRRAPTFDESSIDANNHLLARFIRFSILGNFPLNLFVDALPRFRALRPGGPPEGREPMTRRLISLSLCMSRPAAVTLSCVLICALVSGCAQTVKISYPSESEIHPEFDRRYTTWGRERVEVNWTPSLRAESSKYLAEYDRVLLANSIHEKGFRHEYKIAGKGTPLVVYAKNPEHTLEERHYPTSGITLGITAVKESRPGQVPLLKLYDSFDPVVVRTAAGPDPIAANYTATLAVLYSHTRKVAGSAFASFIRPDNPQFATGIYLIHPYDPNKIPILFIHGLLGSPLSWQNLTNELCSDPKILEHYQPWFFLYPTGQPVLESSAQLREDLQATQRLFDPSGRAVASHHVVVVAHSMGGLLAHTLVSD